jgi:hypothetical protein
MDYHVFIQNSLHYCLAVTVREIGLLLSGSDMYPFL